MVMPERQLWYSFLLAVGILCLPRSLSTGERGWAVWWPHLSYHADLCRVAGAQESVSESLPLLPLSPPLSYLHFGDKFSLALTGLELTEILLPLLPSAGIKGTRHHIILFF